MIRNNHVIILSIVVAGVCAAFIASSYKGNEEGEIVSPEAILSPQQPEKQEEPFVVSHEDDGKLDLEELREKSVIVSEETLKIKKQTIINGKEVSSVEQAISDRDSSIVRTARMKSQSNATGSYTIRDDSDRD